VTKPIDHKKRTNHNGLYNATLCYRDFSVLAILRSRRFRRNFVNKHVRSINGKWESIKPSQNLKRKRSRGKVEETSG